MTFTEIVNTIAGRLNLTSTKALTRIGESVNEKYKELASDLAIRTVEQKSTTAIATIGSRYLTFGPTPIRVQKILAVFDPLQAPPNNILDERSFDELRNDIAGTDPPQAYAIQAMGADSVTIFLDTTPSTAFTLGADVLANMGTLSGAMVPAFTEDFHNLLIYGGLAIEYDKMEKPDLSTKQESKYKERLGEYRLYIASSNYMDIYQGKDSVSGIPRPPLV